MNAQSLLNQVRVASPCSARWEDMEGDDRARFCGQCRKHVFNFSAMTRAEAEALIRAKEGRLCGRYFQRRDGRVLTMDCPTGRERHRTRLARLGGLLFATALVALGSRIALRSEEQPRSSRSRFFGRIDDLVYQARIKLGLVKPAALTPLMGDICVVPAPIPSASTPPASTTPSGD